MFELLFHALFHWLRHAEHAGGEDNLGPYKEPSPEVLRDSKAWEMNRLLKRANALEKRGQIPQAIAFLEEFIAKSNDANDIAAVRQIIDGMRQRMS